MNQHFQTPATELGSGKSRRVVAGVLVAGAVTLFAAPAALANVWSINEVESDFELTDCLTKAEGDDSANFGTDETDSFYIDFDPTATAADADTGVSVLQETLTVKAPAGFRTYSTETFEVAATSCGYDFNVSLTATATNSFGEAAIEDTADWADKGVKLYLSNVADPGDDFSDATDWNQTPLVVNSGGTIVNADTGDVVMADDTNLVVGFELVGGATAGDAGIMRFQVNFNPIEP